MKIYFTAALVQKPLFGKYYDRIIKALEDAEHTVQHSQVSKVELADIQNQTQASISEFYRRAMRWIASADLIIVEASFPSSLNIGHEITLGLEKGKTVVVLYKEGHDSIFLHGLHSDRLMLVEYTDSNLEEVLLESLTYARDTADSRFNFFISPRHISYLDWIAKVRRIPRSVYLRQLIERDRNQNEEYQAENS